MIQVSGDTLSVRFDRFDLEAYDLFLRTKRLPEVRTTFHPETETYTVEAPARFAGLMGVQAEAPRRTGPALPDHLFDYQRDITLRALEAKRWASWWDCGLGKTAHQLEWARQVQHRTTGRVMILAPLNVIPQTMEEARRFYGDGLALHVIESREEMAMWCAGGASPGVIGICNYEKLIPGPMDELRHLAGLVCDESSLLKSGGGVIKWNLIKSARGIEYKLSCTATPAPNEIMEYASQASFLEKLRNEGEILWTFFSRDKRGEWKVKPHARAAFYRFMSSWSIYLRSPGRYGWADNQKDIPAPEIIEHPVGVTPEQMAVAKEFLGRGFDQLFVDDRVGIAQRMKLSQIAKGFIYRGGKDRRIERMVSPKSLKVADLALQEAMDGRQVLVWTVFDEESEILRALLRPPRHEVAVLTGSTPDARRAEILERFRTGQIPILISKASLLGYGMNFQNCSAMVFSGWDDSYERWYQAIRRAVRYGQTKAVRVHVPFIPELEGAVLANLKRKGEAFERDATEQEKCFVEAMREAA